MFGAYDSMVHEFPLTGGFLPYSLLCAPWRLSMSRIRRGSDWCGIPLPDTCVFRGLSSQARTSFPAPLPRRVRPGGGVLVALHEFVAIEERKQALLRTRMAMPY
jgi:hypothetical protein